MSSLSTSLRKVLSSLSGAATIVDVSARDGLQSEPAVLTPAERALWVRTLVDAGIREVEAGSFVSPKLVPQMCGTTEVLAALADFTERLWVLVPNRSGLERAAAAGARNVTLVASATETHSVANLGRSIEQVLTDLAHTAKAAEQSGMRARFALSMAWVDPQEGQVPARRVLAICRRAKDMGFPDITLCDTYGGASPRAVAELLESVFELYLPQNVGLHLHDTFGCASACALVALCLGVRRFEASIASLGGCPFAPGSKGNMATEDLNYLLRSMGLDTGIDPDALSGAIRTCLQLLNRNGPKENRRCPNP